MDIPLMSDKDRDSQEAFRRKEHRCAVPQIRRVGQGRKGLRESPVIQGFGNSIGISQQVITPEIALRYQREAVKCHLDMEYENNPPQAYYE